MQEKKILLAAQHPKSEGIILQEKAIPPPKNYEQNCTKK